MVLKSLKTLDLFLREKFNVKIDLLKKIYNADAKRGKIFIKYHHDHVKEWVEWIKKQDENLQYIAFAKLIEYLKTHPKTWDKLLVDVIVAVSYFRFPESIHLLKNFIITCHRMCDTYPILREAYITSIKGLILNDESVARDIMDQQINLQRNKKEAMELISTTVSLFTFDTDITHIVVNLITFPDLTFKDREFIIDSLHKKPADHLKDIYLRTLDQFIEIDKATKEFSKDCNKTFAMILKRAVGHLDDEKFNLVESLCISNHLSLKSFEVIGEALGEHLIEFDIPNTYKYYAYAKTAAESKAVQKALAQRNELTYQELMVPRAFDLRETFPFERKPLFVEKQTEKIKLPADLDSFREVVADSLSPQAIENEDGDEVQGGGILISGDAFWEKLYIARSIAAEKKWKFIYLDYLNYIEEEGNPDYEELAEEIANSQHVLILIENLHMTVDDKHQVLFERIRELAKETNVYCLGSIPKEISVYEDEFKSNYKNSIPRDLFPIIKDVPYCSFDKQAKIWERTLFELGENRAKDNISENEILISSYDIYSIEFDVYIRTYFHICLLIYGKLVSLEDMQKIGVF